MEPTIYKQQEYKKFSIAEVESIKNDPLANEKITFLKTACNFLEIIELEDEQINGRPRTCQRELLKHLLVMSYNAMSYRRTISDLQILYDQGYIKKVISRSTLNDFANHNNTIALL